jgi:hypothetical protein
VDPIVRNPQEEVGFCNDPACIVSWPYHTLLNTCRHPSSPSLTTNPAPGTRAISVVVNGCFAFPPVPLDSWIWSVTWPSARINLINFDVGAPTNHLPVAPTSSMTGVLHSP